MIATPREHNTISGAEAIACACPPCQVNLDSRQGDIKKADPAWVNIAGVLA